MLNFVDDDDATEFLERRHRLAESREARRILQIEVIGRIRRHDVSRKCGLAALTRPDKPYDAAERSRLQARITRALKRSIMAEIEPPRILRIAKGLSKKSSDQEAVTSGLEQLAGVFGVLETQLDGRAHLLGEDFTVVDVNLASTIREPGEQGVAGIDVIDLAPFPEVATWLDRCGDRPANRRIPALP